MPARVPYGGQCRVSARRRRSGRAGLRNCCIMRLIATICNYPHAPSPPSAIPLSEPLDLKPVAVRIMRAICYFFPAGEDDCRVIRSHGEKSWRGATGILREGRGSDAALDMSHVKNGAVTRYLCTSPGTKAKSLLVLAGRGCCCGFYSVAR